MADRYTKVLLTIIAGALVYICIALTPLPSVAAQQPATKYPGQSTGPTEVVIVGWTQTVPMQIASPQPLRVITERSSGAADRVVLVGWEENATRERPSASGLQQIGVKGSGVPVTMR
jgi:hypothetical protein